MRQKRAKQYRKQIQTLKTTFKFKTPIQCVVDDSTLLEAIKANYDLIKGMNTIVQNETKFFITQCCIEHLYESKNQLAIDLAKRMEKRRCNHKETLSSFDCIKSITNIDGENKFRYLVVTQDENLRTSLRNIAGVPLCFLYRSVLVMEPMSKVTKRVVDAVERLKLTQGLNSSDAGKRLRDIEEDLQENDESINQPQKKKIKNKIKGVNPLAMKKKQQKKPNQDSKTKQSVNDANKEENNEKKKKSRKRKHNKSTVGAEIHNQTDDVEEPLTTETKPAEIKAT
ncbi:hypothetical protein C6P40_001925 [Pichia californica]|uniref:U three protein 23 n=1 Tax=Pichia californica TaxID=460514 RepID=A0A9P6WIH7_9ASCO|nr:hypothetical protein C6P40_001925 [[Candida] californica]